MTMLTAVGRLLAPLGAAMLPILLAGCVSTPPEETPVLRSQGQRQLESGVAAFDRSDYPLARERYLSLLESAENNSDAPHAHYRIGWTYLEEERFADTRQSFDRLDPERAAALAAAMDDYEQLPLKSPGLAGTLSARHMLGVAVPEITIPVAPGRNLAILVEAAVRHQILRIRGYDAGVDFTERQARAVLDVPPLTFGASE